MKLDAHFVKLIYSRGYTAYFLRRNTTDLEDAIKKFPMIDLSKR